MPAVSFHRTALQASFERISGVLTRSKATLIVQHAPEDLSLLPKFPLWLE
ncbi:MAG: hypothetical protein H7138_09150 [Myxococcales bacterium]|nr:hypothetical protein [Myxococcales bacterium]